MLKLRVKLPKERTDQDITDTQVMATDTKERQEKSTTNMIEEMAPEEEEKDQRKTDTEEETGVAIEEEKTKAKLKVKSKRKLPPSNQLVRLNQLKAKLKNNQEKIEEEEEKKMRLLKRKKSRD